MRFGLLPKSTCGEDGGSAKRVSGRQAGVVEKSSGDGSVTWGRSSDAWRPTRPRARSAHGWRDGRYQCASEQYVGIQGAVSATVDGKSRAGEIDDPRVRDTPHDHRRGYRQYEREQWWYMAPPPVLQELPKQSQWCQEVPEEMQHWYDLLQGHWLVGEDDSPHRVTVRLHQGSKASGERSVLRAAFYRADRSGIRNVNFRERFDGGECLLALGDLTLDQVVSTRLWVVWRRGGGPARGGSACGSSKENCDEHWFRGEEAQMLVEFFWLKVRLNNLWLEVDLANSLQARYNAEQGFGLLEACIRWRLADAQGTEIWARVDVSGTQLDSVAISALIKALHAGGAQCKALALRGCCCRPSSSSSSSSYSHGLESLGELLGAQRQPLAELDLRGIAAPGNLHTETWLEPLAGLLSHAAPVGGTGCARPLWLLLADLQHVGEVVKALAARLAGIVDLRSSTDGWCTATKL